MVGDQTLCVGGWMQRWEAVGTDSVAELQHASVGPAAFVVLKLVFKDIQSHDYEHVYPGCLISNH